MGAEVLGVAVAVLGVFLWIRRSLRQDILYRTSVIGSLLLVPATASAQVALNKYVQVYEVHDSADTDPRELRRAIDYRNNILIKFNEEKLHDALRSGVNKVDDVRVLIEASLQQGDGMPQPIEVGSYASVVEPDDDDKKNVTVQIDYHVARVGIFDRGDKKRERISGVLPESFIDLARLGASAGDRLSLKITDVNTNDELNYITNVQAFGFSHPQVVDSFLLLNRRGLTDEPKDAGFASINFRPVPGTTVLWNFRARHNDHWFKRFTGWFGYGYNVSLIDWDAATSGVATGQPKSDTTGSNVEIGMGGVLTLLHNTIHITYGYNLNADSKRRYVGIGFSILNLSQRIAQ